MILDSSVILAILFAEPDALLYAAAIERAASRRLSAATWLESAVRIGTAAVPSGPEAR
jgi:ribonuclease VapC